MSEMDEKKVKHASDWLNASFDQRWKIISDKSKSRHEHEAETLALYAAHLTSTLQEENERLRRYLEAAVQSFKVCGMENSAKAIEKYLANSALSGQKS